MKNHCKAFLSLSVGTLSVLGTSLIAHSDAQNKMLRRPTVADSITMVRTVFPGAASQQPVPSPDGKHFLLITYKGNLERDTIDASLLLFASSDTSHFGRPRILLTWASFRNDPPLSNVHWSDNSTALFLGGPSNSLRRLYSINIHTRKLAQLTHHPTDILDYATSLNLRTIAYIARSPIHRSPDANARRRGLLITDQMIGDLTGGYDRSSNWELSPPECFVWHKGGKRERISLPRNELPMPLGMYISPDGKSLVIGTELLHASPESWKAYITKWGKNQNDVFFTYRWIDLTRRSVRPLINAPTFCLGCIAWSPDSQSVILGGTYLPLDVNEPFERESRRTKEWAVAIDTSTGEITKLAEGNFQPKRWRSCTNIVMLTPLGSRADLSDETLRYAQRLAYQRLPRDWKTLDPQNDGSRCGHDFDVEIEQNMNTPPRIVTLDQTTGARSIVFDLNPQFRRIRFGHVEEIQLKGTGEGDVSAGLYLPVDYQRGEKYPLVIQTHGWDSHEFWIDGYSTAGYAAQALSAKGFIVAQLPMAREFATPEEGPRNVALFEKLIDDLDARGMIDRSRVGLLGFSRTGYAVRFALAFSKYRIAAAVLADAMEAGYYEYVATTNLRGGLNQETYEEQNGAAPYGEGLRQWISTNPSFNLDRIYTPVRLLTHGPYHLGAWEWFAGLKRLGKPVELTWLPDAAHEPVRPLERLTEQQGDVDWFCFWLKNEEDPDTSKIPEFSRWRAMRTLEQRQH